MASFPDFLGDPTGQENGTGGAKEKAEKDLAVNELTDQLTVAIALRKWDEAVLLVEQGM